MRNSPSILSIFCCLIVSSFAFSQKIIEGKVYDSESKKTLNGVLISIKNASKTSYTDENGLYKIIIPEKAQTLIFSLVGYANQEVDINNTNHIEVGLRSFNARDFENIVTIGSRNQNRTKLESPVAVDVIPAEQLNLHGSRVSLTQILNSLSASFNSNKQSGADASDHVDPFSLRGLAPDQTLVLINGKRYHPSSLFNLYGSQGRGTVNTDLNCLPINLIDHIEILKDGAAAQYGSDAIGGVINIVLKKNVEGGEISAQAGQSYTGYGSSLNYPNFGKVLPIISDGRTTNVDLIYGIKFKSGYLNLAGGISRKNSLLRPNNDSLFPDMNYRIFSDAKANNSNLYYNSKFKIKNGELYSFGGLNVRETDSYLWTIFFNQKERVVPEIYNSDYNPTLNTLNYDGTNTVGYKSKFKNWNIDFSNTLGYNQIDYRVNNSINASLLKYSPTSFFAGDLFFIQNSTNLDFNKRYDKIFSGLNIGFGAEYRFERYKINPGEEASWQNYSPIIKLNIDGSKDTIYKLGGVQGFPGFKPQDVIKPNRKNIGFYADAELDISRNFLVASAVRIENYSDFGNALGLKLASRWRLFPTFLLRGSVQTSFRAPSLAQLYFNKTALDLDLDGQSFEKIFAANNSELANKIGIPPLKAETSFSGNLEMSYYPINGFQCSLNAYSIDVKDRVILSGRFEENDPIIGADLKKSQLHYAQFLSNALNTKTIGLDITSSYLAAFGKHKFNIVLKGNINKMSITDYNIPEKLIGKESVFISDFEAKYLISNAPSSKIIANFMYNFKNLAIYIGATRYSGTSYYNYSSIPGYDHEADELKANGRTKEWLELVTNKYEPRIITDISLKYTLKNRFSLKLGVNNVFDVYPSIQNPGQTESGGMWEATQMGFGGAYYFTKLSLKF